MFLGAPKDRGGGDQGLSLDDTESKSFFNWGSPNCYQKKKLPLIELTLSTNLTWGLQYYKQKKHILFYLEF